VAVAVGALLVAVGAVLEASLTTMPPPAPPMTAAGGTELPEPTADVVLLLLPITMATTTNTMMTTAMTAPMMAAFGPCFGAAAASFLEASGRMRVISSLSGQTVTVRYTAPQDSPYCRDTPQMGAGYWAVTATLPKSDPTPVDLAPGLGEAQPNSRLPYLRIITAATTMMSTAMINLS
jgi:hypothetical protein